MDRRQAPIERFFGNRGLPTRPFSVTEKKPGGDIQAIDFDERKREFLSSLQDEEGKFLGRFTPHALAVATGMHPPTFYKKLRPGGPGIRDNELQAICQVLEVPVERVLKKIGLIPEVESDMDIDSLIDFVSHHPAFKEEWSAVVEDTLRLAARRSARPEESLERVMRE